LEQFDNLKNERTNMNKQGLIDAISSETKISKITAARILNTFIRMVKERIVNGEKVKLAGFGTFQLTRAAQRLGRNPKTGETIQIAATVRPRFIPSPLFKIRMDNVRNSREEC